MDKTLSTVCFYAPAKVADHFDLILKHLKVPLSEEFVKLIAIHCDNRDFFRRILRENPSFPKSESFINRVIASSPETYDKVLKEFGVKFDMSHVILCLKFHFEDYEVRTYGSSMVPRGLNHEELGFRPRRGPQGAATRKGEVGD